MNEDRVWELQRILRLIPAILHNQFDIRLTDVDSMLITARRKNKVSSLDSD
jgi:ABC-type amino acid transport substrate-binding protein